MDAVITYVDGLDPLWQADFEKFAGSADFEKRFRDWGTLKYLLRGIERNMPFIENVFLVVARESQVPEWVDRDKVRVVLHSEIIPAVYLPTFNSTAIEMFLHRIPGLSEEYVYFNDDMFPVRPLRPESFFRDGKGVIGFSNCLLALNGYRRQARNSCNLARVAAGLPSSRHYLRVQHSPSPMLKSLADDAFGKASDAILASVTRVRRDSNLNQYVFIDYQYFKGKAINERHSNRHYSMAVAKPEKIAAWLHCPDRDMVCINDVEMTDEHFRSSKEMILKAFDDILPEKSRFEL